MIPPYGTDLGEYLCSGSLTRNAGNNPEWHTVKSFTSLLMCLFCKACYNLMSLCSMCTLLIMALRNCLILSAFMFPGIEIYTLLMLTVNMCMSVLSNDIFLIECLYLLIAWRGFARYLHSDHESLTSPCPFGSRLMTANLSCGCLSLLNYWSTILHFTPSVPNYKSF